MSARPSPAPPRNLTADGLVLVGLDPGVETGLAVWSSTRGSLVHVTSGPFWHVHRVLTALCEPAEEASPRWSGWRVAGVVIEDPRQLPVYARHRGAGRGERDRIARSVGRIDRDVDLWAAWLTSVGYAVRLVEPTRRKKWDRDELRRITGWSASTNEHGRDAARLVVGMSTTCVGVPS